MKIRLHRGTLAEAMETAKDIEPSWHAAFEYLAGMDYSFIVDTVACEPYGGVDVRNGWDTHAFVLNGNLVAFTDGPITA